MARATASDAHSERTLSEIRAQLARILRTAEFLRNRSASRFLEYVVEESLAGRGANLKAFTIGVAVFERGEGFDPQNNSIVRVQAARLRQLLARYYDGAGANDPMRIDIPLGGYRPTFLNREWLAQVAEDVEEDARLSHAPEFTETLTIQTRQPKPDRRYAIRGGVTGSGAAGFCGAWPRANHAAASIPAAEFFIDCRGQV